MNRRDFVVCSASAAAGLGIAVFALPASGNATLQGVRGPLPYKVVVDTRFRASCSFGAHAARLGLALRPIAGDVTALWFRELQPLWAKGDRAVVGMTTSASLLCLEQLARDQWMRVVARVEHQPQPDGTLRHRLFLPGDTLTPARVALAERGRWAERLVGPLVAGLASRHTSRPAESVVLTSDALREDRGMTLVSWVIAARPSRGVPNTQVRSSTSEVAPI
jgi:hypothetical protein